MTWRGLRICAMGALLLARPLAAQDASSQAAIPGGTFIMGTAEPDIPRLRDRYSVRFPGVFENEAPAHRVTVAPFRMGRYEVTNAEFAAFLTARPEWRKERVPADRQNGHYLEDWTGLRYPAGQDRHPVVFITWHAAEAYCGWAGGRLPTEAEWEYAARGGGDAEFPWGDALPTPDRANYRASGLDAARPVGSYPAGAFGLFDMAGNVWELLADEWREHYSDAPHDNGPAGVDLSDRERLDVRGRRALRGGSYGGSIVNLRTRWRDSHEVTNATAFVGFRCAYPG